MKKATECSNVHLPRRYPCDMCKIKGCSDRVNRPIKCMCHRVDEKKRDEYVKELNEALDKLRASLKRVKPEQINLMRIRNRSIMEEGPVVYFSVLPVEERAVNSRSLDTRVINSTDFARYCEQCGERFITVNRTRRLCDVCHEEICEKLGVVYFETKPLTEPICRKVLKNKTNKTKTNKNTKE